MFRFARPTPADIAAFRSHQSTLPFSHPVVGSTRGQRPPGFRRDYNAISLGSGEAAWSRAKAAIRVWRMFDLGWVELYDVQAPITVGTTVAVLVHSLGLWSLNAARIVYLVDEPGQYGFAYGTLPDHAECGEERFSVTRDAQENVRYELLADSRPEQLPARLGHPWVRRLQKRFAVDSLRAMQRATVNVS